MCLLKYAFRTEQIFTETQVFLIPLGKLELNEQLSHFPHQNCTCPVEGKI